MVKVGNLTFVSICGLFDLVIGPNPCMGVAASLCMYSICGGVLFGLTFTINDQVGETIAWVLIAISTLTYLALCLSSPGIPTQIVMSAKG